MTNKTIDELVQEITLHQHYYYNDEPRISDAEFDALWDELKRKDPQNALFSTVPKDAAEGFAKVAHIIPMGSQEKASSPEAFAAWAKKMPFSSFIVQYKLDGASLELQYHKGHFTRAVTRGDGTIGDDISANVQKMSGFMPYLPAAPTFSGGIRGEVIMTRSVHRQFFAQKANCRNAANGLMKRKDGIGVEHLTIICYDAVQGGVGTAFSGSAPFANEYEKLSWLQDNGFLVVPYQTCEGVQAVVDYRAKVMALRDQLDYDIDGLVIKHREIDPRDAQRPRPDKQIAFKFSLEEAITTLRSVEWSESGPTYTPIAVTDPVKLAGTTVKRANLCNPNIIRALHLQIGSTVAITKRGEIIPKIEALVENPPNTTAIVFPTECGTCHSPLRDEGTRLFCPNPQCPKRRVHQLKKWISTLDIRGLGDTLVDRLFDEKKVRSIAELYTLTSEDLVSMERMGKTLAQKLYASIHSVKQVSLAQFIAGFDIDGIGKTMVEKLILAGFTSLEQFFSAKRDDFVAVDQFGDALSTSLVNGLQENKAEMQLLCDRGDVSIIPITREELPLHGLSFCFTGKLSTMTREEAQNKARALGASIASTVNKTLSYLVTNTPESGSSKNKKAREYGTKLITEQEFIALLT